MLICPLSVLTWRFEPTIVVVLLALTLVLALAVALALALMLILLATRCANLHATNQLNINSKNLAVSSVQNKHKRIDSAVNAILKNNFIEMRKDEGNFKKQVLTLLKIHSLNSLDSMLLFFLLFK
jgi:Tfp pilus assembly protein PilO